MSSPLDVVLRPELRTELRRVMRIAGLRKRHVAIPFALVLFVSLFDAFAYSLLVPLSDALAENSFDVLDGSRWFGWIPGLLPESIRESDAREAWLGVLLLGMIIGGRTAAVLTQSLRGVYVMRREHRFGTRIREATFARVLSFGRRWFDESSLGRIDTELGWSTAGIRVLLALEDFLKNSIGLLVKVAVMVQLSLPLTIAVLVVFPAIQVAMTRLRRRIERVATESADIERNLRSRALDLLGTLPLVKALGMERRAVDSYGDLLRQAEEKNIQRGYLIAARWPAEEILILLTALLAQAVVVLTTPDFAPGDLARLAAFLLLVQQAAPQLKVAGDVSVILSEQAPLLRAVGELWRDEGKHIPAAGDRPFEGVRGKIEVDGLDFAYRPGDPVLRDVSVEIPAGARIALVGESGSGKSTFASLLARLYDAPPESIRIDGVPLESYDVASFYRRVALVSQEVWILNRTLRENLVFGLEDVPTDAELDAALSEVGLELPPPGGPVEAGGGTGDSPGEGGAVPLLDRVLGDRGAQLSGGQRQRIALVRALLREPDLLVLDEATSALDSAVEARVEAAVERRFGGSVLVVIAHRLSTVRNMDRILVFRDGRIVESGGWDELLAAGGEFSRLHAAQFESRDPSPVSSARATHPE